MATTTETLASQGAGYLHLSPPPLLDPSLENDASPPFLLFPALPAEIRLEIWAQAVHNARVVQLNFEPKVHCTNIRRLRALDPVASLLLTCRESHAVAARRLANLAALHANAPGLANGLRDLCLHHVDPQRDVLFLDDYHAWLPPVLEAAWQGETTVTQALASVPSGLVLGQFRKVAVAAEDVAAALEVYCVSGAAAVATFQNYFFLGTLVGEGSLVEEYVVVFGAQGRREGGENERKGPDGEASGRTELSRDLLWDAADMIRIQEPEPDLVVEVGRQVPGGLKRRCLCPQRFTGDGAWLEVLKVCWENWRQDALRQNCPFPNLAFSLLGKPARGQVEAGI